MRSTLLVLALAAAASAQDRPTIAEDSAFTFSFRQAWKLDAAVAPEGAGVTEAELLVGIGAPSIRKEPLGRRTRPGEAGTDGRTSRLDRSIRHDPLEARGELIRTSDGWTVRFERIEFSAPDTAWRITFGPAKVETTGLLADKWKGTPDEWDERLGLIERKLLEHYRTLVTPGQQRRGESTGPVPVARDEAKPLFVTLAVEEQLAGLLLARLNGRPTSRVESDGPYPARIRRAAGQILARLEAHAAGTLAPAAARVAKRGRVEGADLSAPETAVPGFGFAGDEEWTRLRARQLEVQRTRLLTIVDRSRQQAITESEWDGFVAAARRTLDPIQMDARPVLWSAEAAALASALAPRVLEPGRGTFDYDARSSKAEARGTVRDEVVRFFDSGSNRWRVALVNYETTWTSEVSAK